MEFFKFFEDLWAKIVSFFETQPAAFWTMVGLIVATIVFLVLMIVFAVKVCKTKKLVKAAIESNAARIQSLESDLAQSRSETEISNTEVANLKQTVATLEKASEDNFKQCLATGDELLEAQDALATLTLEKEEIIKEKEVLAVEKGALVTEVERLTQENTELKEKVASMEELANAATEAVRKEYTRVVQELNTTKTENDILLKAIHIKTPAAAKKKVSKKTKVTKEYEELAKMTRTELVAFAKEQGLTGYTQLKRADLVPFIYERITK